MSRTHTLFITLLLIGASVFAAKPPKWIGDPKTVYPNEKYLARTGSGSSEDEARVNALSTISGYFKTQVVFWIFNLSRKTH